MNRDNQMMPHQSFIQPSCHRHAYASGMVAPVNGYGISTPYGKRGSYWSCNEDSNGNGIHTGVDYACPSNTPLVAAIAGTIRHRNYGSAFGDRQFAISPSSGQPFANGEVFYAHGNERLADGTEVQVGQVIGKSGARGNVSGPHLHFEYHPNHKNAWNCGVVADPAPVLSHGGGGSTPPPSSGGPYVTEHVYSNKVGMGEPSNGDAESDTVKELRLVLDHISLVGGQTLGASPGVYDLDVDEEVRLWQDQIAHDPPDPAGKSYLGPNQFAAMFPSPPYTRHDAGLPAIASGGGSSGGGGSGSGGSNPGGGGSAPAAPALILPNATWDPIPKNGGGYFTGLRPYVGTAKKITLHTTEGSSKPNWQGMQSGIPHLTVDLNAAKYWQHLDFGIAAYTLKGGDHSPNSDSGLNIQIEIIGFAAQSGGWSDTAYNRLRDILTWLCDNNGVPYAFQVPFTPPARRLRWDGEWDIVSGILGHCHVPYNDHWDPGDIDTDRLTHDSTPPPVDPPPVPEGEYVTKVEFEDFQESLAEAFRTIADMVDPDTP